MDIDGVSTLEQQFNEQDFHAALNTCEIYEIENCGVINEESCLNYTKQLILYMIVDDMDNARHLWRRIDENIKAQTSQLVSIWEIGKLLWQSTDIPGAFQLLQKDFDPSIQHYVMKLIATLRERQFQLIGKAYQNVSLSTIAQALGLANEQALELCKANGWSYDVSNNALTIPPPQPFKESLNGFHEIGQLMEHVAFLERKSVTKEVS